jgi:SAM-dependent methyltransferase
MSGTLRQQLLAAMPEDDPRQIFYANGRPHPPYNELSVVETFAKFKSEFLPQCPLKDPLDRDVRIVDTSFRKLINLKHKALGDKARAYKIIEEIENGTFDPNDYEPLERDRIMGLFWVPDVVRDPDAIFKNNHRVVKADEVFVYVYNKADSKIKLAFTSTFGPKFNPRVEIVTSYLTDERTAMFAAKGRPLYVRGQK